MAYRTTHKKIIIIGAGSAGLSAQKVIQEKTKDYLLIDKGPLGTTCARVGCMPSKALIEAAKLFNFSEKLERISVKPKPFARLKASKAVFNHVRKLTKHFVDGVVKDVQKIPKKNILLGKAHFVDKNTLKVGKRYFTADYFIIATGSIPLIPLQFKDFKGRLLTSDDIFQLRSAPKTLAVVGAGAIGLELALALRDLGSSVTVYGSHRGIGGLSDPDLKMIARDILGKKIKLVPEDILDIKKSTKGKILLSTEKLKGTFDEVLMATGREPNLSLLNDLDLPTLENGRLKFDEETGHIPGTHFYIAGDAKGTKPFLHEANFDGVLTGLNAVRSHDQHIRPYVPLRITFTSPQIALVGQSFKELQDSAVSFETSEASFENQGRSKTKLENEGHLKLYIHPQKRTLLGSEIFTHAAEHLAHFLALAMTQQLTIEDILATPIYHPVIEEGLRTALKRGLKTKNPKKPKTKV